MHASMFVPNTSSLFGGSLRNNLSEQWGQAIWSFVLILCPSAAGSRKNTPDVMIRGKKINATTEANCSPVGTLKVRNDDNIKIRWARILFDNGFPEIDVSA